MVCTFLTLSGAFAQKVVTGTVTDDKGDPLPGVTVILTGSNIGTFTNNNGVYEISAASDNSVLEFIYLGFKKQSANVGNRSTINIALVEDVQGLEEVVVVGYATMARKSLVGSVDQIGSKELMKAPMQNISNMLTGKLSGLTSIQQSGKPGSDGTSLYIRGLNTYSGGNGPMVIVDGVPRTMDYLNPNDIESVSILKDASASIYGVQGANGVVLITTKSGGDGPAKISYDGSYTATQNTAMPEYLTPSEYMYWHNKAMEMDDLAPLWTADIQNRVMNNDPDGIWGQTDWIKKVFRTGLSQQHNISATGGSDKTKYYASAGYMNQEGTLINTSFTRYNVRTNLDVQVAKNMTFTTSLAGYRTDRDWPGTDISNKGDFNPISQATSSIPIIKDEYKGLPVGWYNGSYIKNAYAALTESGYKRQSRYNIDTNFKLEYDFSSLASLLKGIKVGVFASYNYGQTTDSNYDRYYEIYTVNRNFDEGVQGASGYTPGNSYSKSSSWGDDWMLRPQISYSRVFSEKHSVSATFLQEKRKGFSSTMSSYKRGYFSDDPVDISLGTETSLSEPSGSHGYTGQKSYVGRLNYVFNNKYLAEFLFRTDWSYRFAPDNRRGFFPSASLGWVLSEESFFSKAFPNIEYLKLRASYGQAGKDNVTRDFMYNSLFSLASNSMVLGGKSITQFYSTNSYIVRNLTWSTTHSYNIGIDLNMWNGKLGMELDAFYQLTADILEGVGSNFPPSLAGFYPTMENSGKVENKGFELTLKHNNRINRDWSYNLKGNFAFARNKVLHRAMADNHPNYQPMVGESMRVRYGFKALGLFQSWEEIDNYPMAPSGSLKPGDIKYLDYNGDGMIDRGKIDANAPANKDYVKIGYGDIPEINFSMNMELAYKNFYLNMLWQGVSHVDYELSGWWDDRNYPASTPYTSLFQGNGNTPKYLVEQAWTPENPDAKFPRLTTSSSLNNAWQSSWWVINGEYLRMKNMNFGYTIPNSILKKTPFSRINIYLAGTNLLTLTHFRYVDPESPSVSTGYYPQQKTYSAGINVSF